MTIPNLIKAVSPRAALTALVMTFVSTSIANSQAPAKYPIMEQIAQKVIEKYQKSTCADLKNSKGQPVSGQQAEMMAKAVEQLKNNPDMRQAFFNKVSPTIVNKMFECGMIP